MAIDRIALVQRRGDFFHIFIVSSSDIKLSLFPVSLFKNLELLYG
jgi:hypothetical protein